MNNSLSDWHPFSCLTKATARGIHYSFSFCSKYIVLQDPLSWWRQKYNLQGCNAEVIGMSTLPWDTDFHGTRSGINSAFILTHIVIKCGCVQSNTEYHCLKYLCWVLEVAQSIVSAQHVKALGLVSSTLCSSWETGSGTEESFSTIQRMWGKPGLQGIWF